MQLCSRLLFWLVLAAPLPAAALQERARAELDAIQTLSRTSNAAALARLEALEAGLGKDTPYPLWRDLLRTEVWLREDAGQLEQSYAADRKALALALANHDPASAAQSRLGAVRQFIDQNRPDEAQAALNQIRAALPKDAPLQVTIAMDNLEGDVFNVKARFDKALAAYLRALKLSQQGGADAEARSNIANRIGQVYINTDNPANALEITGQALAEQGMPARAIGRLHYTQGIALIKLKRDKEGLAAFNLALRAARQGALTGLEASVRGNLADYYLRQHDYLQAADEARLALSASEQVNDQNLIMMAKANLGFALMGQGRFAEGAPYVDQVIAALRQAGVSADLDAMLDEKGRMQEQAGLYKDALATVRAQQEVQQTSARAARDRAVAALQEEYAAGQRTRQIEQLRRDNSIKDADLRNRRLVQLLTTLAAVLTVLGGAVVFVLYRRAAASNAKLHQLNAQLEYHSMRDALTGLHNRRSFSEKMKARAQRQSERRHDAAASVDCLALMDIDHFKHINDRWGHGVGDTVLVEVARRLTLAVRDSDMVLRWGGEEFLIFAPGADRAHITELIARVLNGIGQSPVDAITCQVPVTLTAGVVCLPFAGAPGDGADWERAIRLADWALYQGKAGGRNQAQIVTGLGAPVDSVLAALDDKSATPAAGLVMLDCVRGPAQAVR